MTTWKQRNYSYYITQKRILSSRPEYKARRRDLYKLRWAALLAQDDYVAPKRGRPKLYTPIEALERKRESARMYARTDRSKNIISGKQKNQHVNDAN